MNNLFVFPKQQSIRKNTSNIVSKGVRRPPAPWKNQQQSINILTEEQLPKLTEADLFTNILKFSDVKYLHNIQVNEIIPYGNVIDVINNGQPGVSFITNNNQLNELGILQYFVDRTNNDRLCYVDLSMNGIERIKVVVPDGFYYITGFSTATINQPVEFANSNCKYFPYRPFETFQGTINENSRRVYKIENGLPREYVIEGLYYGHLEGSIKVIEVYGPNGEARGAGNGIYMSMLNNDSTSAIFAYVESSQQHKYSKKDSNVNIYNYSYQDEGQVYFFPRDISVRITYNGINDVENLSPFWNISKGNGRASPLVDGKLIDIDTRKAFQLIGGKIISINEKFTIDTILPENPIVVNTVSSELHKIEKRFPLLVNSNLLQLFNIVNLTAPRAPWLYARYSTPFSNINAPVRPLTTSERFLSLSTRGGTIPDTDKISYYYYYNTSYLVTLSADTQQNINISLNGPLDNTTYSIPIYKMNCETTSYVGGGDSDWYKVRRDIFANCKLYASNNGVNTTDFMGKFDSFRVALVKSNREYPLKESAVLLKYENFLEYPAYVNYPYETQSSAYLKITPGTYKTIDILTTTAVGTHITYEFDPAPIYNSNYLRNGYGTIDVGSGSGLDEAWATLCLIDVSTQRIISVAPFSGKVQRDTNPLKFNVWRGQTITPVTVGKQYKVAVLIHSRTDDYIYYSYQRGQIKHWNVNGVVSNIINTNPFSYIGFRPGSTGANYDFALSTFTANTSTQYAIAKAYATVDIDGGSGTDFLYVSYVVKDASGNEILSSRVTGFGLAGHQSNNVYIERSSAGNPIHLTGDNGLFQVIPGKQYTFYLRLNVHTDDKINITNHFSTIEQISSVENYPGMNYGTYYWKLDSSNEFNGALSQDELQIPFEVEIDTTTINPNGYNANTFQVNDYINLNFGKFYNGCNTKNTAGRKSLQIFNCEKVNGVINPCTYYLKAIISNPSLLAPTSSDSITISAVETALFNYTRDLKYTTIGYQSIPLPPPPPPQQDTGGCFSGNCLITMSDGTVKYVSDLKSGDIVKKPSVPGSEIEQDAVIECIFETKQSYSNTPLVKIRDLVITPYHPIVFNGKWSFPCEHGKVRNDIKLTSFFSILLKENNGVRPCAMIINDIPVVSLAHGLRLPVVQHEYFGSEKVVDDMKLFPGWINGHICISDKELVAIRETNADNYNVSGLKPVSQTLVTV